MTKYGNNFDCLACSDIADSIVKFDESGDGLARYTIYNYQKNSHNNGYDYKVNISSWSRTQYLFELTGWMIIIKTSVDT